MPIAPADGGSPMWTIENETLLLGNSQRSNVQTADFLSCCGRYQSPVLPPSHRDTFCRHHYHATMRTHLRHLLTLQLALILPWCHSRQLQGTQEQPIIHGQSSLTFYGWLGPPLGSRLPECAGNCDSSDDCQPGLACFGSSREEEHSADKIPGCSGFRYASADGIKSDYCYDPSKVVANRADLPTDSDALLFVGKDVGFELGE